MTRALMTVVLCTAVFACSASTAASVDQAAAAKPTAAPAFDSSKAFEHLRQMVLIGPRPAGSAALKATRAYITKELAAFGLAVKEQAWTAQTPQGAKDMVNLSVTLPGRRTDRILITGHYDTKPMPNGKFVGASDGASSAAMLIELARVLKPTTHEFTYEFVWFDGEEAFCLKWDDCKSEGGAPDNTYGSRYYVAATKKANALPTIKAMILLDMVGAKDLKLRKDTDHASPWLNDIVWAMGKKMGHGNVFIDTAGPVGGDDHQPFAEAGVPTIDIIDLYDYPQWHDKVCCDDLSQVAARSLQVVGDVLLASLPEIEKKLTTK